MVILIGLIAACDLETKIQNWLDQTKIEMVL